MKRYLAALKHGLIRSVPFLVSAGVALLASSSFQHYVSAHPGVATFVPVLAWLLHAAVKARKSA